MADTTSEIIATRQNRVITKRLPTLNMNLLALYGGRPYIDASLSRFPAESSIDWFGASSVTKEASFSEVVKGVRGRKDRAYLVNHAGRIAERLKQYVFSTPPVREGINEIFENDIDRTGRSIDSFMRHISDLTTACKWAWIGIDMPETQGEVTMAQARSEKIRPYWTAYAANEVADWHYNEVGELTWILTEGIFSIGADPFSPSQDVLRRCLWYKDERGKVSVRIVTMEHNSNSFTKPKVISDTLKSLSFTIIPFVLVGEISDKPHWFDDVEQVQGAILDLESANDTMYFKHVYQQLVLPAGMAEETTGQTGRVDIGKSISAIVGGSYAIIETAEEKGTARVISPSGDALGKIQDELMRKRQVLFDTVGMHLQIDSKQIESADAKSLDRLDSNAVLAQKAQILQEAEEKAVAISNALDKDFKVYKPLYNMRFDVSNLKEDVEAIIMLNNLDLPDSSRRLLNKAALEKIEKVANMGISTKERQEAIHDIEEQQFMAGFEAAPIDQVDHIGDPLPDENPTTAI